MSLVCGVDVGSLRSLSYIAWLQEQRFVLDLYIPSIETPLPSPPFGHEQPEYIGFDVPQGLPEVGCARRVADEKANTPTRKLPGSREELHNWLLYKGLIEAGVDMFWAIYSQGLASIAGLASSATAATTVFETYPRYVIKCLWPGMHIPSKRQSPLKYVDIVWGRIQAAGYSCDGVVRPAVDHVDAMLCALAAEAHLKRGGSLEGAAGIAPALDIEDRVLREGYIIGP